MGREEVVELSEVPRMGREACTSYNGCRVPEVTAVSTWAQKSGLKGILRGLGLYTSSS